MKKISENKNSLFVCKECGKLCKSPKGLGWHIHKMHNAQKYYDKWIKGDKFCKICKSPTKFMSFSGGYKNTCSKNCENKLRINSIEKSNLKNYGIKNVYQLEKIKRKRNKTMKTKYGAEQTSNSKLLKNKREKTMLKKYGSKSFTSTNEFQEKRKQTCIKKFGFENNSQNRIEFEKMQKCAFKLHQFKDTNLTYQGSYELDFLEKYYNKIDIKNGPSVSYLFEGENKVYHSDFYIPSKNLVVEIKNSYLSERDKEQIKAKERATISNGFNYIIIIDKNYKDFNILSSSIPIDF